MAFKIYTKTGDKGLTGLIGGTKLSKSHIRIEAYGTVDELNSHIGLVSDLLDEKDKLRQIQNKLFVIGSILACDPDKDIKMEIPSISEDDIVFLENGIDEMDKELPEMKSFILPGGHVNISQIHIARTVCRRAERISVALTDTDNRTNPLIVKYLNRLSDYLFTLARFTALKLQVEEVKWKH